MSIYTEPTDLLLLEPAYLASRLRAVVENGMLMLAARYDEASASKPSANGGWSAKQVVGHLIDSAGNNIQRAVRLSIDPELRMPGYKQAEWVEVQGYQDRPWAELLLVWQMLNVHFPQTVQRVNKAHLSRIWFLGEDRVTMGCMLEDCISHMKHHLERMPLGENAVSTPGTSWPVAALKASHGSCGRPTSWPARPCTRAVTSRGKGFRGL
jgi:hypothetical protein